jgi:maltose alpha-D-glucosyltransferase/alpha-amylase
MDAVPFVIESTPRPGKKPTLRFEYLDELHDFLQWRTGDGVLLAEANITPDENTDYFGEEGDRLHMILNFQVNQHLFYAFASGDCRPLTKALQATAKRPSEVSQWGTFLRTHDELDLGRLTDEQRARVFEAFAPEDGMQLYGRGIRRRIAAMLGGDARRLELAQSLLFALPGTPILRYGDEIGMGDDLSLPERQSVRTPMQWTDDRNGGFSTAKRTVLPAIADGPFGYRRINVAEQRRDPTSLLNCTERLIRMRKETPELGWGECRVLRGGSPNVLVLACTWRGNTVVTVHNFAAETREVALAIPEAGRAPLTNLLSPNHSAPDARGVHHVAIEPYGYRWYRVGPLLDVTAREPR